MNIAITSALQVFEFETSKIRSFLIEKEPWFVGKDVATALGYSNASKAVMKHVDEEDKRFEMIPIADSQNGNLPIGQSKTAIINESGLYGLIMSSKLPSAKQFKRWVTAEVLPSLRKTGKYSIEKRDSYLIEDPIARAERWIEETKARLAVEHHNKELIAANEVMQPKAEYFDALVDADMLTNIRITAKELKIGQRKLVTMLLDKGYLYRDSKKRLLPKVGKGSGFFEVKETRNTATGYCTVQTFVTPKGRSALVKMLERESDLVTRD